MIVKLLIEHHLEFQSLKGGCRGSSESTHVKMPHCWIPHALAQIVLACFAFAMSLSPFAKTKFKQNIWSWETFSKEPHMANMKCQNEMSQILRSIHFHHHPVTV